MSIYVFPEIRMFFVALIAGAAVLLGYNLLIIIRMLIRHKKVIIIIEDMVYWIIAAWLVFITMFRISNGVLRIGFVLGAGTGMIICNCLLIKHLKRLIVLVIMRLKKHRKGAETFGCETIIKGKEKNRT